MRKHTEPEIAMPKLDAGFIRCACCKRCRQVDPIGPSGCWCEYHSVYVAVDDCCINFELLPKLYPDKRVASLPRCLLCKKRHRPGDKHADNYKTLALKVFREEE